MNALNLDVVSAPDGTVTVRLPEAGRFRVHVQMTWEPAQPELRRPGRLIEGVDALESRLDNPQSATCSGSNAPSSSHRGAPVSSSRVR